MRGTKSGIALVALALSAGVWTSACTSETSINIRFTSTGILRATTEVRSFVFDGSTTCKDLAPEGLPYGDAEERTGLTAKSAVKTAPRDTLAEIDDLSAGSYTLVVEGWGPPCLRRGEDLEDGPACEELAREGRSVLRGYVCKELALNGSSSADIDLLLAGLVSMGSEIRVPNFFPVNAVIYDADNPLPVVDGLLPGSPLRVQLVDEQANRVDDAFVRWSVVRGSGWFDGAERQTTKEELFNDGKDADSGISTALLRAGAAASGVEGGHITVEAYAPGYEHAPIEFEVRAVRSVDLDVSVIRLPPAKVALDGLNPEMRPVLATDLNHDGYADIAVIGGSKGSCAARDAVHQLGVLYGSEDGTFQPAYSAPVRKHVRAMASAQVDDEGRRVLIAATSDYCGDYLPTPNGEAFVVHAPAIEVWSHFDDVPGVGDETLRATRREFTQTTRCVGSNCAPAPEPIRKGAISIDAQKIDQDSIDEIAMSRCSYITSGPQIVNCHMDENARSDSELVLMTADVSDGEITALYERAVIPSTALDSGYRDVRIADLSGDGSADLIATTLNEVTVVCGHANLFDSGFGFADNVRREDATVGISQAFSLSLGQFDGRGGLDAIIGGGLRASSDVAGIKLFPSEECGFVMNPKEALITGPTTGARFLIVKTGDLNFDGFDDALVLHRETRILELHLGSGGDLLAQGPSIALPAGANGELGLYIEHPGEGQVAVAATTTPAENTVHVVRIRPAPRAQ